MPLTGDLSGFSLDEVLSFIMHGGKSGRLVLTQGSADSVVYFDHGVIVEADSGILQGSAALAGVLRAGSSGTFVFYEEDARVAGSMRVDAASLPEVEQQARSAPSSAVPVLPGLDEKLEIQVSFEDPPALPPFEWLLLAEIPRRSTLRHLGEGRTPAVVQRAVADLVQRGLVRGTGENVAAGAGSVRLLVVRGYTREEEAVEVDQALVTQWKNAGVFNGRVSLRGQVVAVVARERMAGRIVLSASACRSCGVRDGEEVEVAPAP